MSPIIAKPLDWIKRLFLLVFPMFGSAEAARAGDPAVRWLGRIVVVGVVLGILAAINQASVISLSNLIRSSGPPWVSKLWLPLLALCLYAMLWLGWWLYRLLNLDIEPVGSDYPDIDRAWSQALEAMGRADIALDNAPLFVVMGWPSVSDDDFFRRGDQGPGQAGARRARCALARHGQPRRDLADDPRRIAVGPVPRGGGRRERGGHGGGHGDHGRGLGRPVQDDGDERRRRGDLADRGLPGDVQAGAGADAGRAGRSGSRTPSRTWRGCGTSAG